MTETLAITFVNPPHADRSLANNMTYLMRQSHYMRKGRFSSRVKWLPAPYKWNQYTSIDQAYNEIKHADIIMFLELCGNLLKEEIREINRQPCKTECVETIIGTPYDHRCK